MAKTAISSAMGVGKWRKASELRRQLFGGPSALLVDPLGFDAGDSNLYRYVNNTPTSTADPSGFVSFNIGKGDVDFTAKQVNGQYAIATAVGKEKEPGAIPVSMKGDEKQGVATLDELKYLGKDEYSSKQGIFTVEGFGIRFGWDVKISFKANKQNEGNRFYWAQWKKTSLFAYQNTLKDNQVSVSGKWGPDSRAGAKGNYYPTQSAGKGFANMSDSPATPI